jgi:hypothetical protein
MIARDNERFLIFSTATVKTVSLATSARETRKPLHRPASSMVAAERSVTANVLDVVVECVIMPESTEPVPTLSQWALVILSMLFGLSVFADRRRLFFNASSGQE